ncbi:MAG: hypothetical protein ABI471_05640 [Sphingomonas bacterium]
MKNYNVICTPEPMGSHIHFSVMMRGIKQHIFVSSTSVDSDARQRLSSSEAALYVAQNVHRFVEAAIAKLGDGLAQSIMLDETDRVLPRTRRRAR